jgi:hypothetical protein
MTRIARIAEVRRAHNFEEKFPLFTCRTAVEKLRNDTDTAKPT